MKTRSVFLILAALAVPLMACVTVTNLFNRSPNDVIEAPTPELVAQLPTAEVFNPLDPSPTPSASDLPLPCQVTDLRFYIDRSAGFCFAYPLQFTLDMDQTGINDLYQTTVGSFSFLP
jgi:hypothetical protein